MKKKTTKKKPIFPALKKSMEEALFIAKSLPAEVLDQPVDRANLDLEQKIEKAASKRIVVGDNTGFAKLSAAEQLEALDASAPKDERGKTTGRKKR